MPDIFNIGVSALLANQSALSATSNNIANVNTPGYSRQRVDFNERPTEQFGRNFLGTGVEIGGVTRFGDSILSDQVNSAASSFGRADAFSGLAAILDNLLADSQSGLSAGLQQFFNAVQDLADDPSSTSARQVLLSEAESLAARLRAFDGRLNQLNEEVNGRVNAAVTEINDLAQGIADINKQILAAGAAGRAPPELLDQRDLLVARLAELVRVDTVTQADGTLSVFIGSGQSLVLGTEPAQLSATPGGLNPERFQISLVSASANVDITNFLSGGELGGILDFRREVLDPAANELGRIAVGLTEQFNAVHQQGVDLQGNFGGDFFNIGSPQVFADPTNGGTGGVTVSVSDPALLEPTGYLLVFDGAAYQLVSNATGANVPLTGSGSAADPFLAQGLSIVVSGTPAAGDQFQLEALSRAAGSFSVAISDANNIAAAAPIRTIAEETNVGTGTISAGVVTDVNDPGLLTTTTIEFLDATTYSINGAGAFAYTSGSDIVMNGTTVQISGAPQAGDRFLVEANTDGVGDNRNALQLAAVRDIDLLIGGTASLLDASSRLVAQVGAQTLQSTNQRDAEAALLNQAEEALNSVRGVNLDEEAADLIRYEQAYQAAAQTIAVAENLFQTLLIALRR